MLFQNIELYNVAQLGPAGPCGQRPMLRVPEHVARHLNSSAQQFNLCNCGVELRFNMLQDTVRIRMCTNEEGRFARQYVYFGDTGAPWAECVKTVGPTPTQIEIQRPNFSRSSTPVFCTDLFYCESDLIGDGRAAAFRTALRRAIRDLAAPNVVHIDGCALLTGPAGLSADLVHPNVHGARQIAENLTRAIRENLGLR